MYVWVFFPVQIVLRSVIKVLFLWQCNSKTTLHLLLITFLYKVLQNGNAAIVQYELANNENDLSKSFRLEAIIFYLLLVKPATHLNPKRWIN